MARRSALEAKKRKLERELSQLKTDLRQVRRGRSPSRPRAETSDDPWGLFGVKPDEADSTMRKLAVSLQELGGGKASGRSAGRAAARDERFASYFLSPEFRPHVRPPREELRLIRNKAIFMLVIAGMILYWLLCRFL